MDSGEEQVMNGGEELDVNGEGERGVHYEEERVMDGGEERDVNGRGGTSREGRGGADMIVVTGATGNAGSQVVRALAARGERVRGVEGVDVGIIVASVERVRYVP